MRLLLFSIMDTKSGVYDGPLKARADGEAMRAFEGVCLDANHPIGKNPEDYHLVRVGAWDDTKGMLVDSKNEVILSGLDVVAKARSIAPGSLQDAGNGNGQIVPVREADSNEDAHGFVSEEDIINA